MLIIFIDAYPFNRLNELLVHVKHDLHVKALEPGFGYSVNLHNELFSGVGPDEIGYFGEWNFKGFTTFSSLEKLFIRFSELSPILFRIWRLVLNKIFRVKKFYIPLRFSKSFERKGIYPFVMRGRLKNIIEEHKFQFYVADAIKAPLNRRDIVAIERAMAAIHAGAENVLISLCDLDGMFHEYGTKSSEIFEKIDWLSKSISELTTQYIKFNPDSDIVILSDHGICDANTKIKLDLGEFSKPVERGELVYFYDSLYLSVWSKNKSLSEEFSKFVIEKYNLIRITDDERINKNIKNPKFGDEIFICPEGASFSPNFFGFRSLKAYHGYHPSLESSKGILASNFPCDSVQENKDVYKALDFRLKSKSTNF